MTRNKTHEKCINERTWRTKHNKNKYTKNQMGFENFIFGLVFIHLWRATLSFTTQRVIEMGLNKTKMRRLLYIQSYRGRLFPSTQLWFFPNQTNFFHIGLAERTKEKNSFCLWIFFPQNNLQIYLRESRNEFFSRIIWTEMWCVYSNSSECTRNFVQNKTEFSRSVFSEIL